VIRTHLPSLLKHERKLRRVWAEFRFFLWGVRSIQWAIYGFLGSWLVGTVVERYFGAPVGGVAPDWDVAAFYTFTLLFGEVAGTIPEDWLGQAFMYGLPVLGILFLAEGLFKLGFTIFNKKENMEKWMSTLAATSRGHVILCGLGQVGYRTLEELLALGCQVFVIEKNKDNEFIQTARMKGVDVLVGDARSETIIRSLNIEGARAVVIVTNDDLANLEIAMDVREVRADIPIVMRLFDQKLAKKVQATLNVDVSFSTSRTAAPLFASAAMDKRVVGSYRAGDNVMLVFESVVGALMVGRSALELQDVHGLNVLAIKRVDEEWDVQPLPGVRLRQGDRVQLLVPSGKVQVAQALCAA